MSADRTDLLAKFRDIGQERIRNLNQALLSIARWWSRGNPAAALEWIDTLKPPQVVAHVRDQAFGTAFDNLSRSDPGAAAALVFDIPSERWFHRPLKTLLEHWLAADPAAAFNWIRNLPKEHRAQAIKELPGLVRHADFGLPYERLNPSLRNSGLAPEMVLRFFISLPPDEIDDATLAGAVEHWAYQDLDGATDWLDRLPHDRQSPQLAAAVLRPMQELAPELAPDWLSTIPEGPEKISATRLYINAVAQSGDPRKSLPLLLTLPEAYRGNTINSIAARCEPERDMPWIEALPAEEKQELMPALISRWLETQPNLAREYVKQLETGPMKSATIGEVIGNLWKSESPEKTLQWLTDTCEAADFEHVEPLKLAYGFGNWWRRDREAASAWIEGLGNSPMKDYALGGMALTMLQFATDVKSAHSILRRIKNDAVRKKVAEPAIRNLMSRDPSLALEWMDALDLEPERQNRLLTPSLYPPNRN